MSLQSISDRHVAQDSVTHYADKSDEWKYLAIRLANAMKAYPQRPRHSGSCVKWREGRMLPVTMETCKCNPTEKEWYTALSEYEQLRNEYMS